MLNVNFTSESPTKDLADMMKPLLTKGYIPSTYVQKNGIWKTSYM